MNTLTPGSSTQWQSEWSKFTTKARTANEAEDKANPEIQINKIKTKHYKSSSTEKDKTVGEYYLE